MGLTKTEAKILDFLVAEGEARFTDVKKGVGIPDKTVYEIMPRLIKRGLVKKTDNLYSKTNEAEEILKGEDAKKFLREEKAGKTVDISDLIREREQDLEEVSVIEEESAVETLRLGIPRAILGRGIASKISKLNPEQEKLVEKLLKAFEEGTELSVYPVPEDKEEARKLGENLLEAVGNYLRESKKRRDEIADRQELTIMFTLDLSGSDLDEETLSNALYYAFS